MKTSFANTFKDLSEGRDSGDKIFPDRVSERTIVDDSGNKLPPEHVLVLQPYDDTVEVTERTSTLLLDHRLKQEYEHLHTDIDLAKDALLNTLKELTKSKKDLEKEISHAFTHEENQFFVALARIETEVLSETDSHFSEVNYDTIFDERVLAFLNTRDFKEAIHGYITKYNELLDNSTYFSRSTFNYFNARQIAKTLAKNGFFEAQHSVNLNAPGSFEAVKSLKQLEDLISNEESRIVNDVTLRKKFEELQKGLERNETLREFRSHIKKYPFLLPKLGNLGSLKQELWISYIKTCSPLYKDLLNKYSVCDEQKKIIEAEAKKQHSLLTTSRTLSTIGISTRSFSTYWRLTKNLSSTKFYLHTILIFFERLIVGLSGIRTV